MQNSERYVKQADEWEKRPIQCTPDTLRKRTDWRAGPLACAVTVKTHHRVPIAITTSDARVQERVTEKTPEREYERDFPGYEVTLAVPAEALLKDLEAVVTVTSKDLPNAQAQVKVHVTVRDPLVVTPRALLFGVSKADRGLTREVRLSAPVPFRVTQVDAGSNLLRVTVDTPDAAHEHLLTAALEPAGEGEFTQGKIRITTDFPGHEAVEVEYVLYATGE